MRTWLRILVVSACLLASSFVALPSREAGASVAFESRYTFEQTFGTALRLLRVDLGCKITEKDAENGYMIFEYSSGEGGKQVHRGAVEVVRARQGVHVSVQLPSLPRYHEQMIVDALARKLVAEHGEPPARDKTPPPPADADAGTDAGQ
jgi:hypothetical protein